MHHLRLVASFMRASAQAQLAYRANFYISALHSLLNLATAVLGLYVLFSQVQTVNGWDFPATLALLGVYLTIGALRGLFIGPSLDALAGMDGEVWSGRLDYTLLRPANVQFMASLRHWQPFALLDLGLGLAVILAALRAPGAGAHPRAFAGVPMHAARERGHPLRHPAGLCGAGFLESRLSLHLGL